MKTIKIPGLGIDPPKAPAFAYETPAMLPKLHQACLAVGPRGSGKNTAVINLMERLPFDRIYAISPTMQSNIETKRRLKIADADIFSPEDPECMDKLRKSIEQMAEELDRYRIEQKRFDQFMKKIHSSSPIVGIPVDEMSAYFDGNDFSPPPPPKFGDRKPCCAVLIDDCMGSSLFTKNIRKLNQFVIFMRHVAPLKSETGALGCSVFILCQSYKSQAGGISRVIRAQTTSMIIFAIKDKKQLDEIAEEVGGEIDPETFLKVYKHAIRDKHDFLFVDLHPKEHQPSGFRRALNEFIIPQ